MSFFDDILNKAKGFLDGFKNSAPMNDRESKEEKKVSKENNVPKAPPAAPKKTLKERLFEEQDKIGKIKDCPHGKCYSDGCNFFHTCDITVSCSEKKKNGRYEDLFLPDLEKYIGYFCYWTNNNDLSIDNKYYTTSNKAKACIEIFLDYLINTLAPGKEFLKETFFNAIKFAGVKNSNMINMLATVGKADVDESVLSNIDYLLEALKDKNQGLDSTYPFWGDRPTKKYAFIFEPSLYERDYQDFKYTVNVFLICMDPCEIEKFLVDTSVVDISCFYDENGKIKPAGLDRVPGDTIYQLIESWSKDNEISK